MLSSIAEVLVKEIAKAGSTVELYHSMSGHTVTIRVLLLKRQEHHLNALAGNDLSPVVLSVSIFSFIFLFIALRREALRWAQSRWLELNQRVTNYGFNTV